MKQLRIVQLLILTSALFGCSGGSKYWTNSDYSFPVRASSSARAVVMPVQLSIPGLDPDEASAAFTAGIVTDCGTNCVPAQPLQPVLEQNGMGDLGSRLARGLYQMGENGATDLDGDLARVILGSLDLINGVFPDASLRYLITGDIEVTGPGMVPNTSKVRVMGGLFDVEARRPVSAFWYEETIVNDTALASLGLMGQKVIQLAECPMDDDSCAQSQAALSSEIHFVRF